jgi:hypothetical protein
MSKSSKFLEAVKEYGDAGRVRDLERKLNIPPAVLIGNPEIPDLYDYLDKLIQMAKDKGISYKVGAKEDLWPASQPGPGDTAKTQLTPQ